MSNLFFDVFYSSDKEKALSIRANKWCDPLNNWHFTNRPQRYTLCGESIAQFGVEILAYHKAGALLSPLPCCALLKTMRKILHSQFTRQYRANLPALIEDMTLCVRNCVMLRPETKLANEQPKIIGLQQRRVSNDKTPSLSPENSTNFSPNHTPTHHIKLL